MSITPPLNLDPVMNHVGPFGRYQVQLLLVTQCSYLICTGSLLSGNYIAIAPNGICKDDEMNNHNKAFNTSIPTIDNDFEQPNDTKTLCDCQNIEPVENTHFVSLFEHLGIFCHSEFWKLSVRMSTMIGGILGATGSGFLADRYGRRRTCISAVSVLIVADFVYATTPNIGFAILISFVVGAACGGVMTVNLLFLMECVGSEYRLLCATLNGWPFGMMTMALVGYLTGHWRSYLIATASLGVPFVIMFLFMHESPRWLILNDKVQEAEEALRDIALSNRAENPLLLLEEHLNTDKGKKCDAEGTQYSYSDLLKDRYVLSNVLALSFNWFSSAMLSYGVYFTLDHFSRSIFLNFFLLGLFKLTTGTIPLLLNMKFNVGRKPTLCFFIFISFFSSLSVIIIYYALSRDTNPGIFLVALTLIGAAAVDPIWKINHLHSAELFPTVVRGMARGVCNIGSRLGSSLSPIVAFLGDLYIIGPYFLFGALAMMQLAISLFAIPETKDKPLPEALDTRRRRSKTRPDRLSYGSTDEQASLSFTENRNRY